MSDIVAYLQELIKHSPEFLSECQRLGWGNINIVIKEGKPVMVKLTQEKKLN